MRFLLATGQTDFSHRPENFQSSYSSMGHRVNEFNSLCWLRSGSMIIRFFGCEELINGNKTSPATCQINRRKSDCQFSNVFLAFDQRGAIYRQKTHARVSYEMVQNRRLEVLWPFARNEGITCFKVSKRTREVCNRPT